MHIHLPKAEYSIDDFYTIIGKVASKKLHPLRRRRSDTQQEEAKEDQQKKCKSSATSHLWMWSPPFNISILYHNIY